MLTPTDKSRNFLILMAVTITFFTLVSEVILFSLSYSEQKSQLTDLQSQWTEKNPNSSTIWLSDQEIENRMNHFTRKVFPITLLVSMLLIASIASIFYFITHHYINPNAVIDKNFIDTSDRKDHSKNSGTELIHAAKLSGIGEFASTIVHDLKNPLTMVFANLDILSLKYKKKVLKIEEAMEHIERIRFSAKRIKRLVDHMNRITRDDFDLSKFISIKEVFKNSLIILESKITSNEVEIRDHIFSNIEKIQGDANSLEQVLMNLIANSIDAMEFAEKKWIEISAQSDEDKIRIRLKDSGPGVPEHLREKIFNPFFTSKEEGKGTGLGLSICQKIIDAHKGTIELNSPEEGGAEFIITLPKTHSAEYQQEIAS